jgi:prefoldin subunit 5
MNLDVHHYFHTDPSDRILLQSILRKVNTIMATQAEVATSIAALTVQVTKIQTEVQGAATALRDQIAALEAIIAAGGAAIPELEAAVDGLRATLQTLDDLNPDAP